MAGTTIMAMAVVILTVMRGSDSCKATPPILGSKFVNESESMFCSGFPEESIGVEENAVGDYVGSKTRRRDSSVCGRFYMGSYVECITSPGSPKPKNCRSKFDRTC